MNNNRCSSDPWYSGNSKGFPSSVPGAGDEDQGGRPNMDPLLYHNITHIIKSPLLSVYIAVSFQ